MLRRRVGGSKVGRDLRDVLERRGRWRDLARADAALPLLAAATAVFALGLVLALRRPTPEQVTP